MTATNNAYLARRKERIFRAFGGCCGYCNRKLSLTWTDLRRIATLDHHIPRCYGGRSTLDNLWLACHRCNGRKRDMMPNQWYRENPTFNRVHPGVTRVTVLVYGWR